MNEYLDQREMDALLQNTTEGQQAGAIKGLQNDQALIQPYDLTSPKRVMSGRMPRLENVNQEMAYQLRVALSGTLRRLVEVKVLQPQMTKLSDFLDSLPMPASLHLFRMRPLRGTSIIALEPKLVFALIDMLFGGSGDAAITTAGRHFTSIESRMIRRVVNLVLEQMSLVWQSLHTIQMEYERCETNPEFAKIVAPTEVVMTTAFEVAMDAVQGNMTLCIPYATLEPLRDTLYATTRGERIGINTKLVRRLQQHVQALEVEARVDVGHTEMSLEALLQLQVGDIICLDKNVRSALLVRIETVPKFTGLPCKLNQQKALQITSRITPGEEDDHE